jgi:hypothetical protein
VKRVAYLRNRCSNFVKAGQANYSRGHYWPLDILLTSHNFPYLLRTCVLRARKKNKSLECSSHIENEKKGLVCSTGIAAVVQYDNSNCDDCCAL